MEFLILILTIVILAGIWYILQQLKQGPQGNLDVSNQLYQNRQENEQLRQTIDQKLTQIQQNNDQQLERMRQTVEEKLESTIQSRLKQSMANVNQQLESVNKSLGEMQSLSQDVASLNKTLSGTKTRGIMGEVQLGNVIEDILTSAQYEREVPTIAGSSNRVEFAIKLPGEHQQTVWLPIDSKFPLDSYERIQTALDNSDREQVDKERKALAQSIRKFAQDINSKYIQPPQTTDFGIMFLPTENLYSEVVRNAQLVEELRKQENVIVTGPSTIAAILNALSVGFKTLTIEQNAQKISQTLGKFKAEFESYNDILTKAQKQLNDASKNLDRLSSTRTKAMDRILRDVEALDDES